MPAKGMRNHLVIGLYPEAHERHLARPHRPSLGMYAADRVMHRAPSAIVRDDGQRRQAKSRGGEMAGARHAEDVAPVADHGDRRLVGRAELDAQGCADAPSEMARGRMAELRARALERDMTQAEIVLVDEDGALV